MTDTERLALVRSLLDSDVAFEADCLSLDEIRGKAIATRLERQFAGLICRLYRLVHPGGGCLNPHDDWMVEAEKLLAESKL